MRGAHEPQVSGADGAHGGDRVVERGGEAADGLLLARDADEARAVGQLKRDLVIAIAAEGQTETRDEALAEELAGLALARADDEDHGVGHEEGRVYGFEGDDGGLAPLAGAIEQTARVE
jgi:hypothetical protein